MTLHRRPRAPRRRRRGAGHGAPAQGAAVASSCRSAARNGPTPASSVSPRSAMRWRRRRSLTPPTPDGATPRSSTPRRTPAIRCRSGARLRSSCRPTRQAVRERLAAGASPGGARAAQGARLARRRAGADAAAARAPRLRARRVDLARLALALGRPGDAVRAAGEARRHAGREPLLLDAIGAVFNRADDQARASRPTSRGSAGARQPAFSLQPGRGAPLRRRPRRRRAGFRPGRRAAAHRLRGVPQPCRPAHADARKQPRRRARGAARNSAC